MIFDSPQINKYRNKYKNTPIYEWPEILRLATGCEYENERKLIDELLGLINDEQKRNSLIGDLLSNQPGTHIGAWFELLLYDWLRENFEIEIGPKIGEDFPDFLIKLDEKSVVIEAKALLIKPVDRKRRLTHTRIFEYLREIQKPFGIHLEINSLGTSINKGELVKKVTEWLDMSNESTLLYTDDFGNHFLVDHKIDGPAEYVCPWSSSPLRPDINAIREALQSKTNQHRTVKEHKFPYIIALFLEPPEMDSLNVSEAWFGNTKVIIDWKENKIVGTRVDRTGLHYFKDEIHHHSVSGTLIFKIRNTPELKRRKLDGWYIENPYASTPIPTSLFPVLSKFIVLEKTDTDYFMNWV